MARERYGEADDYRDDPRSGRQPKTTNAAHIVGLVLGGMLLLGVLACVGVGFLFWAAPAQPPAPPAANADGNETAKQVYARDAFAKLVVGKTRDEVRKILGQPESTNEGAESWRYLEVTTDPVTGKTDHSTTLWFDAHGRVERVSFP